MYERRSRLSKKARDRLLEHFVAGTTARAAAELGGVHLEHGRWLLHAAASRDGRRAGNGVARGRRGRSGKLRRRPERPARPRRGPVFGLFKHGGKVYTVMIPNVRTATLRPMIERMIRPDSIVYTDGFRSDDALDVSAASAKEGHVKVSDDVGSPVGSSERPDEAILGRAAESHEGVAKCAATLSGRKQAYSREGRRRSAQVPRKRGWDRTHVIVLGANPVRFI